VLFSIGAASGCTQQVDQPVDTVGSANQELYLLGKTWPGGSVSVCFDSQDGNNSALLSQARKLLADSWSSAANISFTGWGSCNYLATTTARSFVAVHFAAGTNGVTSVRGRVAAKPVATALCGPFVSTCFTPGVTHVTLISDDPDRFQQQFRYEVIHEFGHALAFAHEQERPDNWTVANTPIFCNQTQGTIKALPGGTTETTFFDVASIMDYCTTEPLVGGPFRTSLSAGDIQGVRKVYGRKSSAHGFMILSDRNSGLAVNAFNGAAEGRVLALHDACTIGNPDCTWTYQYGMLVSDRDPTLAINATNGANEGTVLTLTRACTPANPDCTWTYQRGQFLSDRNPALAINAGGGAQFGTQLVLTQACTADNPDCTWTMPNVMLSSARNSSLGVNALNGAREGGPIALNRACTAQNKDCTWTFTRGVLISNSNTSLALVPSNGGPDLAALTLAGTCLIGNPICSWTWSRGELVNDKSAGALPINALGGALHLTTLGLNSACTPGNADCVFSGLFARN